MTRLTALLVAEDGTTTLLVPAAGPEPTEGSDGSDAASESATACAEKIVLRGDRGRWPGGGRGAGDAEGVAEDESATLLVAAEGH